MSIGSGIAVVGMWGAIVGLAFAPTDNAVVCIAAIVAAIATVVIAENA